ncbi:hypothetical protein QR680_011995 [Steinernema hermaphroditum]|uniref:Uncharacterized protein n=1 Tax=Steinernema hermaphroditum TaxID=289476 RepID=A0AA39I0I8_9BILA|nr:hypothetical protein QR680_011995 [Steinernema hermaphroditum]
MMNLQSEKSVAAISPSPQSRRIAVAGMSQNRLNAKTVDVATKRNRQNAEIVAAAMNPSHQNARNAVTEMTPANVVSAVGAIPSHLIAGVAIDPTLQNARIEYQPPE